MRYIQLDIKKENERTCRYRRRIFSVLAVLMALACAGVSAAEPVNVFAAASLKNALDAVSAAWKAEAGKETKNTYAASSALAKQIEQAAPADVFISADLDWMDYVAEKKLIKPDTRKTLLGNALVLVAAKDSGLKLELKQGADLAGALAGGKLAVGDVKAVPAGKYAKAALEKLGLWASVEASLAQSRECPRRIGPRRPRRSQARHRLYDRRQGREKGRGRRRFSRGLASPHRLSCRR